MNFYDLNFFLNLCFYIILFLLKIIHSSFQIFDFSDKFPQLKKMEKTCLGLSKRFKQQSTTSILNFF